MTKLTKGVTKNSLEMEILLGHDRCFPGPAILGASRAARQTSWAIDSLSDCARETSGLNYSRLPAKAVFRAPLSLAPPCV